MTVSGILDFLCFPIRYLGGKQFSIFGLTARFPSWFYQTYFTSKSEEPSPLFGRGYSHFVSEFLSQEEVRHYIKYSALSAAGHSHKLDFIEPFKYELVDISSLENPPEGFEVREKCLFHRNSGVKITLFRKGDQTVITFGALDSYKTEIEKQSEKDAYHKNLIFHSTASLLGYIPSYYLDANKGVEFLLNSGLFERDKALCLGQCLGGNLACYTALKQGLECIAFNALPFGAGLQKSLGREELEAAEKLVTHVIVEGDQFADNFSPFAYLDIAINLAGLRTPGNFGKKKKLPSAFDNSFETHRLILGSFMHALGFDKKAHPSALVQEERGKEAL